MTVARGKLFEQCVEKIWNNWEEKYKDIPIEKRKELLDKMEQGSWHAVKELKKYIKDSEHTAQKIISDSVSEDWEGNYQGEPKTDIKIGDYLWLMNLQFQKL